ncbi:MAG: MopE-related protein [bacterium]
MKEKNYSSLKVFLYFFLLGSLHIILLNSTITYASSQVVVADVSTKSFSVIYNLSEPYHPDDLDLLVFDGSGKLIREGITIESDDAGSVPMASQANRIKRFIVKGLTANTTYYYQLLANGVAFLPADNPLNQGQKYAVTTEKYDGTENLRITNADLTTNDTLLLPECNVNNPSAVGASLVLVNVLDSQNGNNSRLNDYPLSSWVGECSLADGQKYAFINLNNLFNKEYHTPLELAGGERIEIIYLRQTQTAADSELKLNADLPQETMVYTSFKPTAIPQPRIAYSYHLDGDYDGYGSNDVSLLFTATVPYGYSRNGGDCNDADAQIHPGGAERCDGKDNNCDGKVDENLTQNCSNVCGSGTETCQNGQWVGCTAPQQGTEVCDGIDNNCDGRIDENLTQSCSTLCGTGVETCQNGRWAGCTAQQPQSEICGDRVDNNCDGNIDENCCTGDLNGDGSITPADALFAFRCYLGLGLCDPCADVDKNGSVTPADALCLFRKYLGIPSCMN